ncbi:MAG: prenyltransferase/squalene oxidase repeat-containing protein [Planctomycetota bacterium]|jgi:hypothetical protein
MPKRDPRDPRDLAGGAGPTSVRPEDEDLLLDVLRGEASEEAVREVEARVQHEGALADARTQLERFLARAREAHDVAPDPTAALRVAIRVRDQVAAEESRAVVDARRSAWRSPLAWARVLAVSVGVHVLVLGVLAFQARRQEGADAQRFLNAELPVAQMPQEERPLPETPSPWLEEIDADLPLLTDAGAIRDPITGRHWNDEDELEPLVERLRDHPPGIGRAMLPRVEDALKRQRLQDLGFSAEGTLTAVERGLGFLAGRQRSDGSFAPGGGRSAIGQTGLAVLPFLGEGRGSSTDAGGASVVARGVAWLRSTLFDDSGRASGRPEAPAAELGVALKALSEDFMVSYGRLGPAQAQRRAVEIRTLSARVAATQAPDGSFPGGDEDLSLAVWPMWGLDAATRTGVAVPPAAVSSRFRGWYATRLAREDVTGPVAGAAEARAGLAAAGLLLARDLGTEFRGMAVAQAEQLVNGRSATAEIDPFFVATAGTGLLLFDADAFRTWSHGLGERLARKILPTGAVAHADDVVGETALHLLALQLAYRTY